eukprot:Clim_evm19s88 gene=Clim_evmTU19s88
MADHRAAQIAVHEQFQKEIAAYELYLKSQTGVGESDFVKGLETPEKIVEYLRSVSAELHRYASQLCLMWSDEASERLLRETYQSLSQSIEKQVVLANALSDRHGQRFKVQIMRFVDDVLAAAKVCSEGLGAPMISADRIQDNLLKLRQMEEASGKLPTNNAEAVAKEAIMVEPLVRDALADMPFMVRLPNGSIGFDRENSNMNPHQEKIHEGIVNMVKVVMTLCVMIRKDLTSKKMSELTPEDVQNIDYLSKTMEKFSEQVDDLVIAAGDFEEEGAFTDEVLEEAEALSEVLGDAITCFNMMWTPEGTYSEVQTPDVLLVQVENILITLQDSFPGR